MNTSNKNSDDMPMTQILAWSIWTIASLFYAYQYILRVMPNIMMNDILQQFNIDIATFGQFSGIYYIGYSLMHLPIGILLDRFGPKKVMPICTLMTVIGLLPIVFSDIWIYPIIGRALIGMGSSAAILGVFKIIRLIFTEAKFTRMLSFSVTIGLMGAIYGGGPVNYLCTLWGYKTVTTLFIFIGIGLSALTYLIVPNIKAKASNSVLSDIKEIFTTPKIIAICFFSGLMVGPLEGFADVWGTEFLKQTYGLEGTLAASLPSAIFIGMCFGAPVLSLIAERSKRYFATIVGAGFVMATSFFALISGKVSVAPMSIMFSIVGVCCAYQILAIYKASTYVSEGKVGLTTAIANMIIMIFGYAFHSIIGWVINTMGGTSNPDAFVYGIAIIPITLTIGSVGFLMIMLFERRKSSVICI